MAKTATKTTIKKNITHDRMVFTAKFPSGASFEFRVGRSGEKLLFGFSNDNATANYQGKIIQRYMAKVREEKDLDNGQLFDNLEKLMEDCQSGQAVIDAMVNYLDGNNF